MFSQFPQSFLGICGSQQGTVRILSGSFVKLLDAGPQIDDAASGRQVGSIRGIKDRAAARRKHDILALGQIIDDLPFAVAKPGFTFKFENQRDIGPGATLNFLVAIDELLSEGARKFLSDGCFSRSH